MKRRRRGHDEGVERHPVPRHEDAPFTTDPLAAWGAWVADNMQQGERELSPHDRSTPSALCRKYTCAPGKPPRFLPPARRERAIAHPRLASCTVVFWSMSCP